MTHGASEMRVLNIRGGGVNILLSALGRNKRLLLYKGFRDRPGLLGQMLGSIIPCWETLQGY